MRARTAAVVGFLAYALVLAGCTGPAGVDVADSETTAERSSVSSPSSSSNSQITDTSASTSVLPTSSSVPQDTSPPPQATLSPQATLPPQATLSPQDSSSLPQANPTHNSPAESPSPGVPVATLPLPVQADTSSQLITVVGAAADDTDVVVTGWERNPDGQWEVAIDAVAGVVGEGGIGAASESVSITPAGTFGLTQAFGIEANPGTSLPYHRVTSADWWVSDVASEYYNRLVSCSSSGCPFDTSTSEHLISITPEYAYAVVMDYNTAPVVPGAGSAFFLHVSAGVPTQGCVAIDSSALVRILKWLDPAAHPVIAVGIA